MQRLAYIVLAPSLKHVPGMNLITIYYKYLYMLLPSVIKIEPTYTASHFKTLVNICNNKGLVGYN